MSTINNPTRANAGHATITAEVASGGIGPIVMAHQAQNGVKMVPTARDENFNKFTSGMMSLLLNDLARLVDEKDLPLSSAVKHVIDGGMLTTLPHAPCSYPWLVPPESCSSRPTVGS